MLRLNIKNKHLARFLVAVAVFLPVALITGVKIINSSGAYATGTWGLYFHSNGGHHGGLPDTQYCTPEEGADTCTYIIPENIPERDGYDFMGWATERDALEPEYQPGDSLTTHACVKNLYAVWGYKLSFDMNGGEGKVEPQLCHPVAANPYLEDDELTESDYVCDVTIPSTVPTREDYFFLGWGEAEDAISASNQPDIKVTLSESKTLYAIWAPIYKLIFNLNDKSGKTEVLTCHSTVSTIDPCRITIPEKTPTRDGYDFLGWATIDDTATVAFNPGDILIFGGLRGEARRGAKVATETQVEGRSLMLYAVWKEEKTLPVPDTGRMTSEGDTASIISNAAIYILVPSALLVFGWVIKRASSKKVNFDNKR